MTCRAVIILTGNCEKMAKAAAEVIEYVETHDEYRGQVSIELQGEVTPEKSALVTKVAQELWIRGLARIPHGWEPEDAEIAVEAILQQLIAEKHEG